VKSDSTKVFIGVEEFRDGTFAPVIQIAWPGTEMLTFSCDMVTASHADALTLCHAINEVFSRTPIRTTYDRNGKADLL
jgi:hypothetical protein